MDNLINRPLNLISSIKNRSSMASASKISTIPTVIIQTESLYETSTDDSTRITHASPTNCRAEFC
ncbi:Uncharacterised protein [Vibrio cholerae]|nr:Uncharacterised protein [Vibrio cholerae]CSC59085.1 Uncharacterised protein [Vibrio cholerae]